MLIWTVSQGLEECEVWRKMRRCDLIVSYLDEGSNPSRGHCLFTNSLICLLIIISGLMALTCADCLLYSVLVRGDGAGDLRGAAV